LINKNEAKIRHKHSQPQLIHLSVGQSKNAKQNESIRSRRQWVIIKNSGPAPLLQILKPFIQKRLSSTLLEHSETELAPICCLRELFDGSQMMAGTPTVELANAAVANPKFIAAMESPDRSRFAKRTGA
jgi:hypothetical protein